MALKKITADFLRHDNGTVIIRRTVLFLEVFRGQM